ncbi:MAG: PxKF domain-containing protein [Acidobacteria bacterium]|nr:PxKF domain-containing protein [Acidobacteriota bacterium]
MSLPPRGLTLRVFAVFCLLTISLIHSGTASHAESKNPTGTLGLMPVAYGASIWEYVLTGILLPSGPQIPATGQNDDTSKPAVLAVATVSYTGMTSVACPAEPVATIAPSVPGLTFSQLSRGSGVTCASNTSGISGFGFNGDLPTNLAASKWYKLSIASDSGTAFTVDALSIVASVSTSTAANRINVQYSIDGGAKTSIGEFTPTGSSATAFPIVPSSIVAVGPGHTLNLFFVPYNPNASGTTIRIQNNTSITVTTSPVEYTLTYDGNGNTGGTAPVDANNPYNATDWVGVAGPGNLVKAGYTFGGWDTAADGSGIHYNPAQLFAINANTTLYAQWIIAPCFETASGSLDTTFDGDGKVTTAIGLSDSPATAVALQPDGMIVTAGSAFNGSNYDFALARYTPTGALDTNFDIDGVVITPVQSGNDYALAVAMQPDGKIIAAGYTNNGPSSDFAVVRYNANGTLDPTFDGDGIVTTPVQSLEDIATSVAVQPDGKIVVAGFSQLSGYDFAVVRYNADGSLDLSFDGDGKVTTPVLSLDDKAYSVLIQPDGKIVVIGTAITSGPTNDVAAVRYNSHGTLDNSFGGDGKVTVPVSPSDDQARTGALQPDGKILAAGSYFAGPNGGFSLVRFNSDGTLDTAFDGDGIVTTPVPGSIGIALSMALQPDGRIVTAGNATNGSTYDFTLFRYNGDGSLDTTFDGDGKITTPLGWTSYANSVAIQPDGRIVAAGSGHTGSNNDRAVVRYGGDCPPALSVADVSVNEGDNGTTTFSFTVSLPEPAPAGGVTFDIATADGTAQDDNPATEDNDYVARSLTSQTISAGNTTYTFDVTVNGDTIFEPDETFFVNVTNVTGANIADGQGQGTIQNDDIDGETIAALDGSGNVTVTDVNDASSEVLTLTCSSGVLTVTSNLTIGAGAGFTQSGPNAVTIPLAGITGSLTVDTLGGNDTLNVNLAGCDFIPAGGLFFNGGVAGDDALNIIGGNQGIVTYGYSTTNGDGTVAMSNFGTITYTGLEPITNSGTSSDVIFNLPAVPNAATLADIGGGSSRLSGGTFEQTDFANPTGSVTINRGTAADTLVVSSLAANYPSLAIGSSGGGEFSSISFNGTVTFGAGKNLNAFATGSINFQNAASDVAATGAGTIGLTTATNIYLAPGSSLLTHDGTLSLNANQQTVPSAGSFHGIRISGATIQATGLGLVMLRGRGGDSPGGDQLGISVTSGGSISSGPAGTTIVEGTGGASAGGTNQGVFMRDALTIIEGGTVSVTGIAGTTGTGFGNDGVRLQAHAFLGGPTITSNSASGAVTVFGQGGGSAGSVLNVGVEVQGVGSRIMSAGGPITITGIEGAVSSYGAIDVINQGKIESPGNITLIADTIRIAGSGTSISSNSQVTIHQRTNGVAVNLGTTGDSIGGPLNLEDSELDFITAPTLTIGDANSGPISVTGVISPANYKTLSVQKDVSFTSTGGFDSDVTSLTVFEKMLAAGAVSIDPAASLTATAIGGFVPAHGNSFTIIENTTGAATTGTFDGKPEGGSLVLGGRNAIITYAGGTGSNDVVINVDSFAPKVTSTTPGQGAAGVATNSNITLNFSEAVNIAAGGITVDCGGVQAFTPTLPQNGVTSIVIDPTNPLPAGIVCTVTVVSANVKDLAGNVFDGDGNGTGGDNFVLTFTTACSNAVVVSTNADSGPGSLRQAVIDACPGSTITFDMNTVASPITLISGEIVIDRDLTIQGPGANFLTVSGNNASRIFLVSAGVSAGITGLTLSGGNGVGTALSTLGGALANSGGTVDLNSMVITGNTAAGGGGVYNRGGSITIRDTTISGNTSSFVGGGLSNKRFTGDGTALVTVLNSTISGNSAPFGAAVHNQGSTLAMTNTTVSGNTTTGSDPSGGAGGLENAAALFDTNATLDSCTFNGNQSTGLGPLADEIYSGNFGNVSTVTLRNTIVGGSSATSAPNLIAYTDGVIPALGAITSLGYNLSSESGGGFLIGTADQVNADPLLAPLANNGGPTKTHALCAAAGFPIGCAGESPALAKGKNALTPLPTDQRGTGFPRTVINPFITPAPGGDHTDIGAFEVQALPVGLTYDGNGNTGGTAPVDGNSPYYSGSWVGVLGPGTLVNTGFGFGGWNTAADGSGTHYNPAQLFAITADTTLYAEWIIAPCFYSATGSLDPTFDTDGKVTTPVGNSDDVASSVAIQADGKIVTAGYIRNGTNLDFAVVRYNADGSLDTTFDTDGKVTTPIGSSNDSAFSVAIQPDGKIVAAGYGSNTGSHSDIAVVRYSPDGSLDSTFDIDGKVTTSVGNSNDVARSVAIQPDGKIVVAGYSIGATIDFAVVRYNPDGSLDTLFDTDGKTTTAVGNGNDEARSVAIQRDGKIAVAGSAFNGTNDDFAVVRYNADGSLDTTFDTDGMVTTQVGISYDFAIAVAIQPDGKLVAAGSSTSASDDDFAVVRYNADGSLDTTFDTDGKVTTPVGNFHDYASSVAIQPDGKIVAAGASRTGPFEDLAIVRYNPNGSLDTAFDADGKVTTPVGNFSDVARAVAIQPDGKIVAAGDSSNGSNDDVVVVRYGGNCDTTAPDTTITANPTDPSANANASFSFTGTDEPGGSGVASFECSIDGGAFAACTSPQNYAGLSDGPHTFQVRAVDAAGNTDPTPASYTWTVDTTPPDTTITANPPANSNSASAAFQFTSNETGASFQCSLDGGAFAACTSPQNYAGLSDGPHTFQVRAVDAAGNTDPTPASYTWTVDTAPPDTTITGNPTNPTNSTSAAFTFTSNETPVTFACSLDGSAFTVCTSPQSYAGLALGPHTFQVRATDTAGNTDPTPASYTWVINSPPAISAASGVTRVQAAGPSVSQIAAVGDPDQSANTLAVTVNGGPSATVNGVTVNSITIAPSGAVSASVAAACGATNASFTLRVTDSGGLFAQATLAVTVINETVPPVINPIANVTATLPPNSNTTSMAVSFPLPTATDNCSAVVVTTNPVSGSVFPLGTTVVSVTAVDANGNVSTATFTVSVQYPFSGFSGRVYNPPTINYATAGNTLPMSFSLGGNKGLNIFAAGSPSSQQVSCSTGAAVGPFIPAIGNLMYFGQYSYYWTTDPSWGGTCRTFSMALNDGSIRTLKFWFYNTPGVPPVFIKPGRTRLDLMMPVD